MTVVSTRKHFGKYAYLPKLVRVPIRLEEYLSYLDHK